MHLQAAGGGAEPEGGDGGGGGEVGVAGPPSRERKSLYESFTAVEPSWV